MLIKIELNLKFPGKTNHFCSVKIVRFCIYKFMLTTSYTLFAVEKSGFHSKRIFSLLFFHVRKSPTTCFTRWKVKYCLKCVQTYVLKIIDTETAFSANVFSLVSVLSIFRLVLQSKNLSIWTEWMVYPLQERIKTNDTELARYGQIAAPLHVSNSQTAERNFLKFSSNFARKKISPMSTICNMPSTFNFQPIKFSRTSGNCWPKKSPTVMYNGDDALRV